MPDCPRCGATGEHECTPDVIYEIAKECRKELSLHGAYHNLPWQVWDHVQEIDCIARHMRRLLAESEDEDPIPEFVCSAEELVDRLEHRDCPQDKIWESKERLRKAIAEYEKNPSEVVQRARAVDDHIVMILDNWCSDDEDLKLRLIDMHDALRDVLPEGK